jgi:hypothetical protein
MSPLPEQQGRKLIADRAGISVVLPNSSVLLVHRDATIRFVLPMSQPTSLIPGFAQSENPPTAEMYQNFKVCCALCSHEEEKDR